MTGAYSDRTVTGNATIDGQTDDATVGVWAEGSAQSKKYLAPLAPDDPRHGSASSYCNHRCRCDACRAAWNAYYAQYRRRQGVRARRSAS